MVTIPDYLQEMYNRWRVAGCPAARASDWTPSAWSALRVPASLPKSLNHGLVTEFARQIRIDDFETVRDAFIVTMIWGYGNVGYGPSRTQRVMDQPDFQLQITELCDVARREGGLAAYSHVCERRTKSPGYLKYLGPAFGTKLIYFITRAGDGLVTPILDDVVRTWMKRHGGIEVPDDQWAKPDLYREYVETLHDWGGQLDRDADVVEHLIFAQQNLDGQNVEEWTKGVSTPAELLQRLSLALQAEGLADAAGGALTDLAALLPLSPTEMDILR